MAAVACVTVEQRRGKIDLFVLKCNRRDLLRDEQDIATGKTRLWELSPM